MRASASHQSQGRGQRSKLTQTAKQVKDTKGGVGRPGGCNGHPLGENYTFNPLALWDTVGLLFWQDCCNPPP